jgi:hypothetical protein
MNFILEGCMKKRDVAKLKKSFEVCESFIQQIESSNIRLVVGMRIYLGTDEEWNVVTLILPSLGLEKIPFIPHASYITLNPDFGHS